MKIVLILITTAILLSGCNTVPIQQPTVIPVPSSFTPDDTYAAILSALSNPQPEYTSNGMKMADDILTMAFGRRYLRVKSEPLWYYEGRNGNVVNASYYYKEFTLRAEIEYDNKAVTIRIRDSQNLRQTETKIHKSAYVWLSELEKRIRIGIGRIDRNKSSR